MKTVAALFLALVLSLRAEERHFIEFEGTTSPDGRYAVAWSFSDSTKVDWQKLRKGEPGEEMTDEQQKYFFELLGGDVPDVENCIINKKNGQPVLTLSGFNHWSFRGRGFNRSYIHAAWTPKANMVVVVQDARFGHRALTLVSFSEAGKITQTDALQTLTHLIEKAIARKFAKNPTFKRDREGLYYTFSEFQFLNADRLGLHVDASRPKDPESFTYEADAVFSLITTKTKGGTSLKYKLVSLSSDKSKSSKL